MHELHTPELPLPGPIHKDGGETDVPVDQTTVRAQEAYGFLRNNSVCADSEDMQWQCHTSMLLGLGLTMYCKIMRTASEYFSIQARISFTHLSKYSCTQCFNFLFLTYSCTWWVSTHNNLVESPSGSKLRVPFLRTQVVLQRANLLCHHIDTAGELEERGKVGIPTKICRIWGWLISPPHRQCI